MVMIGLHKVGGWESLAAAVPTAIRIAKPFDDPNYPYLGRHCGCDIRWHFLLGHGPGERATRAGRTHLEQARWGSCSRFF